MRLAVVPAAGRASRLGHKAPLGCKLLVRLPDGRTMAEYLLALLAPHVDEVRFVVRDHLLDEPRLAGLRLYVDDSLEGPLRAVGRADGFDADDLLVWYADTLADTVPEGTDWVGLGWAPSRRPWDVPVGTGFERSMRGAGMTVCAGAYRFQRPRRLAEHATMLEALNAYPGLRLVELPGWHDVDDLPLPLEIR